MLISVNSTVDNSDFESLLDLSVKTLENNSKNQTEKYLNLLGKRLEDETYEVMCECSRNTPFEGTIELISGQKFPDIVANNFYGVEVKSTKQNHWKTTGNSVLESTRVDEIQRIYMLFGKIINPIQFKYRLYQDCLSDVIVTHSPRYSIDMNLDEGLTIFDKIGIDYEVLRQSDNPIKPFKDYYRKKLSKGQELWWIDNEEYTPDSIIFKIWNSLNKFEKEDLIIKGFAYFPEILSNKQSKFDNFTLWLSVKKRVICPNVRDLFTAGGKRDLIISGQKLIGLPKVLVKFFNKFNLIAKEFSNTDLDKLNDIWNTNYVDRNEVNKRWINDIILSSASIYSFDTFNLEFWLKENLNDF